MSEPIKRLRVSMFFRKPRTGENYSIERLFDAVAGALPKERYEISRFVCPFESNGVFRRLLMVIWAACKQGDINHITGDVNFLGILMRRSKTVLTIHDSASMQRLSGLSRKIYEYVWLRLPIYRAGRVTVVSDETLKETRSYVCADSDIFRVIPNCVTGKLMFSPKIFNSNSPRILQVGTKPNKNLLRVIETLTGLSCVLVIIGHLSLEEKQLLKSTGITYENYPDLDNQEMVNQYKLSDVVVFVSTYEGFGLPILEAQMVGRAVVTSAQAPMDKVAGSGAALVNPYNIEEIRAAIRKIVDDTPYRNKLICDGLENVKNYTPEAIADKYANVYEELLKERLYS